jgi:hypothetical protein
VNLTLGTSSDTSDAFVGQWDELMLGVRTNLEIQFLRERYADNAQVAFLAWFRAMCSSRTRLRSTSCGDSGRNGDLGISPEGREGLGAL